MHLLRRSHKIPSAQVFQLKFQEMFAFAPTLDHPDLRYWTRLLKLVPQA